MNLQFIADSTGKTTGVYIPIKDWENLKNKYKGIDIEESPEFHEWQKDIIDQRLEKIANGNEQFQDFDTAIDEIEKEL